MEEMNMFGKKGFSCRTASAKFGTKDGLVQKYDGLIHYQGELGDFWYDPEEFIVEGLYNRLVHSGSEHLLYIGHTKGKNNKKTIDLPKGCIDTSYMFCCCDLPYGFTLGDFDTKDVKYMFRMFAYAKLPKRFTLGDKFNTSNVIDMSYMFQDCVFLEDFSLGDCFDTSRVTSMDYMFYGTRLPENFTLGNKFTVNQAEIEGMFGFCSFPTWMTADKYNYSEIVQQLKHKP